MKDIDGTTIKTERLTPRETGATFPIVIVDTRGEAAFDEETLRKFISLLKDELSWLEETPTVKP